MRPIDELDATRADALLGVVFDIDDTVTRDGKLEQAAFAAMWQLRRVGLRLAAVTGRPLGWCDVIARHWPLDVAVAENGACWASFDGRASRWGYYDDEETRARQRELVDRVTTAVLAEVPGARLAQDQWARRCDVAFDVGEERRASDDEKARTVAIVERLGARALVSSVHVHVVAGDYDKPRGLVRAAKDVLGLDVATSLERWLFVGDSGNDAPAFEAFPVSAGVANVREWLHALPSPPAFVASRDRGEGFAEIARVVLSRRGGASVDDADRTR